MPNQWELVSVLVALEFVVLGAFAVLLFPLEKVAGVLPLLALFTVALVLYWYPGSTS
ncbi:hypothetical protein [Haloarchaeobius sp. TZWWS8]|uniref:hypothetical protein n=1 Tax=Haloarchaeobius sp. TZWWS8 TaxID=3446121 RepID=UPI003EB6EC96